MADDIGINLDLNATTLEAALKQIKDAINSPMQGAGQEQKIQGLNRIITNLMNQQNIYLRAAERSGRIHAARMAEYDRYFEGVASNLRLRASLREEGGTRGGAPISGMLAGGMSPRKSFKRMEESVNKIFEDVWQYQGTKSSEQQKRGNKTKATGSTPFDSTSMGGGSNVVPPGKALGRIGAMLNNKIGGLVKQSGNFFKSSAGKGMMAGGMAGAGIFSMVIKKAIEASPMLQQMMKIVNMAVMLWLRPIGDFFGFMFKPIAMYLLRASIQGLKNIGEMQKMGSEFGRKLLAFFLDPAAVIWAAIMKWASPEEFMAQVNQIIDDAYAKLGGSWSKQMTRYQASVANVSGGYSMEIPAELSGLLVGMEARYGQYSVEIENWLKRAVPIFEEFAIVVPEELIGAWDYYMQQVETGGMTIETVLKRMQQSTSLFVTQGSGAMSNILFYTEEFEGGMYTISQAMEDVAEIFNREGVEFGTGMETEFEGIVSQTAETGKVFNDNFAVSLQGITDNLTAVGTTTANDLIQAEDNFAELGKMFLEIPSTVAQSIHDILGIDMPTSLSASTPGTSSRFGDKAGGINAAGAGGDLTTAIVGNVIEGFIGAEDIGDVTGKIAEFLNPMSSEAVKKATDYLKTADLSKYFGSRDYGGIGASYGTGPQGLFLTDIAKELDLMGGDIAHSVEMEKVAKELIDNLLEKTITTTTGEVISLAEQEMFKVMNAIHGAALAQPDTVSQQLAQMAKAMSDPESSEYSNALEQYNSLQKQFPGMSIAEGLTAQKNAQEAYQSLSSMEKAYSIMSSQAAQSSGSSYNTSGGSSHRGYSGGAAPSQSFSGGYTSKKSHGWGGRMGGWINEPIFGIGRSGRSYRFGETGIKEQITPMHAAGGNGGDGINIIFNIEKIEKDVDLEELQRRIERAILEVHSRRGIV